MEATPTAFRLLERATRHLGWRAPAFALRADQASLLDGPAAFHEAVVRGVLGAKRRVAVASLYVGTESHLEDEVYPDATEGGHGHVRVGLYHTPAMHGFARRLLPPRYKEVVGVNHVKAFVFDDDVLITGANLSHDYFTARQDRYLHLRRAKPIADHVAKLLEAVDLSIHCVRTEASGGCRAASIRTDNRTSSGSNSLAPSAASPPREERNGTWERMPTPT
eukprot:jgi/Pico_ML_1/54567/g4899.t1